RQREVARVDEILGPARALEGPLRLVALDELVDVTDLELDLGLLVPAGALALQEMPEKLLLQPDAVVGIEMRPVLEAMAFEPLLLRCGAHEAFEIAARVQALSAPVRG